MARTAKLSTLPLPPHPAVGSIFRIGIGYSGKTSVTDVKCPACGLVRTFAVCHLRAEMRKHKFSGMCRRCSLMARPISYEPLPAHPAVGTIYRKAHNRYTKGMTACADVTCPVCGTVRSLELFTLRQEMKRPNYSGKCRACSLVDVRAGAQRWHFRKYKNSKAIHKSGYVLLGPYSVDERDLPLFRAMQNRSNKVFEHRFVMAKALGRPLHRYENVDHMDGVRSNNDLANLRIYIKGKNQPGSMPGYGTYYHEWQTAEARNKLLQQEIDRLRAATKPCGSPVIR